MPNKRSARPIGFFQSVRKLLLSAFVVFSFIAYVLHERHLGAAASTGVPGPIPTQVTGTAIPSQGNSAPNPAFHYRNGTYTGPSVDVFYGLVQVQAVIQNGQIANVQFLQYPNDRRTSAEINTQVMPWLTQEAIQAQSANVDLITGATLT